MPGTKPPYMMAVPLVTVCCAVTSPDKVYVDGLASSGTGDTPYCPEIELMCDASNWPVNRVDRWLAPPLGLCTSVAPDT